MKNKINERINKLVDDRQFLLKQSKEHINRDNGILVEDISIIIDNYNNESKEYKTIVKAKQMIYQLTEEISCANTVEDIVRLRKKINYYINKIKKELATRNIEQSEFVQIYEQVNSLRGNISKYLRFLKRDNNLKEINRLYENFENLTKEECSALRKMISNELKYNKRILEPHLNNKKKFDAKDISKTNVDAPSISVVDKNDEHSSETTVEDIILDLSDVCEKPISNDENISEPIVNNLIFETMLTDGFMTNNSELSVEYLVKRINYYKIQYDFNHLLPYDGCMVKNIISLIRNIPKYGKNNRLVRNAVRDYNIFYGGDDLDGFIIYSKKRNSVMNALATIFKSSRLSKHERELLDNYDKCLDWIFEFYKKDRVNGKKLVKTLGY